MKMKNKRKFYSFYTCTSRRHSKARTFVVFLLISSAFVLFESASCSQFLSDSDGLLTFRSSGDASSKNLRIVSWNVQTFFDAESSGTEYSDYIGNKSKWNENLYSTRLDRLKKAIDTLNADILVLEEIENEAVIQDIANRMFSGNSTRSRYYYAAFAKETDAAIGSAVFSRIPIQSMKVHQTSVWGIENPSMRPLIELDFSPCLVPRNSAQGDSDALPLKLFVCHWKSKSGDTDNESSYWRKKQEAVLTNRILNSLASGSSSKSDENMAIVACGDFNQDITDFDAKNGCVALHCVSLKNGLDNCVFVVNPWLASPQKTGSYYYHGKWERIDHIMLAGKAAYENFAVENKGEWVASDGTPFAFKLYTGEGYSDHFPISLTLFAE